MKTSSAKDSEVHIRRVDGEDRRAGICPLQE
jgi:hypothetical protein